MSADNKFKMSVKTLVLLLKLMEQFAEEQGIDLVTVQKMVAEAIVKAEK